MIYLKKTQFPLDWKSCKISDIGTVIGGGTPYTKIQKYYGGEIPWITPKDLSNYDEVYIRNGARNITKDGLLNSSAKLVPTGTVLFTSRAPIGYVAIAKNEVSTNQGFKSIICNTNVHNKFIYYWLKFNKDNIERFASGSTFKEVSGTVLKNIEITLPSFFEQKKIAKILFSLDSKIELNKKMNKILTSICQTIFKRWFIDFNFPNEDGNPYQSSGGLMTLHDKVGKKIPKDWNFDKLGNHTTIKGRIGWKGLQVSEYSDEGPFIVGGLQFKDGGIVWDECAHITESRYEESPEIMLHESDILMTKDGTIGKLAYVGNLPAKATVAAHIHVIRKKSEKVSPLFLFYFFKTKGFQSIVESRISGSVVPALTQKDILSIPIILPTPELLLKFESITNDIQSKIIVNSDTLLVLTKIRDSILPRLMYGKIRIPLEAN